MELNSDGYGYVVNGPETYRWIADPLSRDSSVALLWTDARGTALSVLFCRPDVGAIIGTGERSGWCGLHPSVPWTGSLAVAVRGHGMMAVPLSQVDVKPPLHPNHVAEKLFGTKEADVTIERFADLINGVLAELLELIK